MVLEEFEVINPIVTNTAVINQESGERLTEENKNEGGGGGANMISENGGFSP